MPGKFSEPGVLRVARELPRKENVRWPRLHAPRQNVLRRLKDDLVVRVGPECYDKALSRAHTRPMDFTGRSMKGYVFVGWAD